jgi:TPR repeat protein
MRQSDGAQQVSAAEQELAQERARAEALDRDLAAARQEIQTLKVDQANAAQDASAAERARERARGEALAGNLAAVREENRTAVSAEIASSLRRGDALIASGDLAAARLVLRRAADAGDARAAMTLAETYDPAFLEKLGVHGVAPDLAMARGWYEKAKKLGATEATQRLELLASKQH